MSSRERRIRPVREADLGLGGGRTLHLYDTGEEDGVRLTVVWHHGTPNIGAPPAPLFPRSARLGIRWVSYDRPGYGGSTSDPGRDVASAATYVARVADALGLERFAVMGHSGGGPHALACGALLAERVAGVVSLAGLAPFGAEGLDWVAGMAESGVATLRAATEAGKLASDTAKSSAMTTIRSSPRRIVPRSRVPGPGSWRSSVQLLRPAGKQRSTTTSPTSPPGASIPHR
jgi:pimeloyl-ACP methyl ester carboxylesterase